MASNLEIREVTDPGEITSILTDQEIYDRIADDNCPPREQFKLHDPFGSQYFGGYADGKLIGLIIHHDGKIHVNILKDFRKAHKREFLRSVLSRIESGRIWCEIPGLFPQIVRFAEDEGFREEKIIKDKYVKNGKHYDTHVMVYAK